MFRKAFGSSVSTRFRSCEKRFVTTPVSVATKKDKGAFMSVFKMLQWRVAPAFLMKSMKTATASKSRDTRAQTCSKA